MSLLLSWLVLIGRKLLAWLGWCGLLFTPPVCGGDDHVGLNAAHAKLDKSLT